MHFEDNPISDMHANKLSNYLMTEAFSWTLNIWSRLFRRGPVEYNYPDPILFFYRKKVLKDGQGGEMDR